MNPPRLILPLIVVSLTLSAGDVDVARLAAVLDPAKLATLGPRGANPRVQEVVYWPAVAKAEGQEPGAFLDRALAEKMKSDAARLRPTDSRPRRRRRTGPRLARGSPEQHAESPQE